MFIETKNLRVYIYTEIIDMRCGFERLLYFVRIQMKNDINQGHLYLFFGKNRRRLKALFYDGTGLVQISKRIEHGRFMARVELGEILEITQTELKQIFNGGHIVRPKVDRSTFTKKDMTQVGPILQTGFYQSHLSNAQP
jgi:transposase